MVKTPQISLRNIFLSFGEEPIFDNLNLLIHPRERIALVGRNGSGKSTLLKVLKGSIVQDSGEIMLRKGLSIGYMEQDSNLSKFVTKDNFASGSAPAYQMVFSKTYREIGEISEKPEIRKIGIIREIGMTT